MRIMYDALNPENIPQEAQMVASYIDGENAPAPGWENRFPNAVKVQIARLRATNAGHVLDIERGDASPSDAPVWVRARRSVGADPSVYTSAANVAAVRAAFQSAAEPEPHYWIADWNGQQTLIDGAVARQYAAVGPYDLSVVADFWPGVDAGAEPAPPPVPSQSGNVYVAVEGDNMSVIAERHGVTLQQLEAANPNAGHPPGDFSLIYAGDRFTIPGANHSAPPAPSPQVNLYHVVEGDNMSVIAERHNVTLAALEAANPHAGTPPGNFDLIHPGDVLVIP